MKHRIFPGSVRRDSKLVTDMDRLTVQWASNIRPIGSFHRHFLTENKLATPVVVINDILPPRKTIPSYTAITRSSQNRDNFYRAIGPILILGQIFGQMPTCGVLSRDASDVKFKFFSVRVFFSLIVLLGGLTIVLCCVARLFIFGLDIHSASMVIFYGSTLFTTSLFFRLSWRWPALCRAIEKEEARSVPQFTGHKKIALKTKYMLFTFGILFTAFVEHVLSITAGFAATYGCDPNNSIFAGFYTSSYPQIFMFTDYAHWKGFFLQVYNFVATFIWNYMDLFIILLSVCLASRFDNLNHRILAAKGKNLPEHFWKVTRNEYANLANLVSQIDENVNELVLLSFANNLYIICMQLFNSFDTSHSSRDNIVPCWKKLYNGIFTTTYFIFSFSFLIIRFVMVAMTASSIYSNSKVPLNTLISVKSETYCMEIQRFLNHVTSSVVALSGMRFFHVTRGLILTIAGTVVTYELVLVQFNQPPPSVSANITLKDHCGGIDSIKTIN